MDDDIQVLWQGPDKDSSKWVVSARAWRGGNLYSEFEVVEHGPDPVVEQAIRESFCKKLKGINGYV